MHDNFTLLMKKFLVIVLLLLYGASSFGMSMHLHFCCGKLKNIDFTAPKPKPCHTGKMHTMVGKPCCNDKEINLKIKGEQTPAKVFQTSFQSVAIKPVELTVFVSAPFESKKLLPEIFAPPPLEKDFNHLYCVYRI